MIQHYSTGMSMPVRPAMALPGSAGQVPALHYNKRGRGAQSAGASFPYGVGCGVVGWEVAGATGSEVQMEGRQGK